MIRQRPSVQRYLAGAALWSLLSVVAMTLLWVYAGTLSAAIFSFGWFAGGMTWILAWRASE